MKGGVYVYRCRKPAARMRIPILSWHTAYVGETTSFYHRHAQHMERQPWADLNPYVAFRIPLPARKWLLRTVETLLILMLAPVYNHRGNLWNPRRIPLHEARLQRRMRDRRGWSLNIRIVHLLLIAVTVATLWLVTR